MTQSKHRKMYGRQWIKQRLLFLQSNAVCVMCEGQGILNAATVVDHVKPHRGDLDLFWDTTNWQSLCKTHHDSAKQAQEKSGVVRGGDMYGDPSDTLHHWNRVGAAEN